MLSAEYCLTTTTERWSSSGLGVASGAGYPIGRETKTEAAGRENRYGHPGVSAAGAGKLG